MKNVVPLALLCAEHALKLQATIALGGDTDTIASIAGQVSGGVSRDQVADIEGSTELIDIVERFAAAF